MNILDSIVNSVQEASGFYFLFELAVIIFAVKLFGHLSTKIGQPSVFGKLLVGIILGPSLLNIIHPNALISELAEVGVILLMFLAGLETDLKEFKKNAFASTTVAIGGVILPFLGGMGLSMIFGFETNVAIYVGVLLVATSVSISVQTLRELGKLKTREGVTILGAAVLDDVLGIIILSAVLGLSAGSAAGAGGIGALAFLIVKIALFFVIAIAIGYYVLPMALKVFQRFQVTETLLAFSVIVAMLFAYMGEIFGVAGIVGSYVCGLMLSLTPHREEMTHKVESFSFPFFVPLFFVNIGLVANFKEINPSIIWFGVLLVIVAILGKIFGCALGAKVAKFSNASSFGIGAGMVARGEVGLIIAMIGIERGIITNDLFSAAIIVVIATTLATPPLIKLLMKDDNNSKTNIESSSTAVNS
ncbi:cation:proton antiporter [Bacillus sp. Marseille-P3661]|uniref:cation:proton antiporter n=1 Tax=Bacillus sp. Marseille-P3661 TaxID=1936234 RepID=UPI000C819EF3|nr:cation:proton antiporter [Bacillus sp. Marseille-P3661]